ncbi:MAG TPA: NUDIX domain-containing protein [Gemmatimonadaceae bacterium]|nr:NUDIX domain-containing protein [Gemmatimonadaceae bacterium]
MPRVSAGLLPYRSRDGRLEVLLVHPGGPFWARKDAGAWSIAKGEIDPDEDPLAAAVREFAEETGHHPAGEFIRLTSLKQPGGKVVHAWAVAMDWDPAGLASNEFEMEWPRGSGRMRRFAEVDRAEWFERSEALRRILAGQRGFIEELSAMRPSG